MPQTHGLNAVVVPSIEDGFCHGQEAIIDWVLAFDAEKEEEIDGVPARYGLHLVEESQEAIEESLILIVYADVLETRRSGILECCTSISRGIRALEVKDGV